MARVLEHVVEQHAENAAFLWLLRDRAVDAPHYKREHLAHLDERIEANLDGLRVAGAEGWRITMAALARHQEPGELFAAGVLALESGDAQRIDALASLADKVTEARRGLFGGLGWVQPRHLQPTVRRWLHGADPFGRQLGIVACSHHRVDPGPYLAGWLADPSPAVRARACSLAGELGRVDLQGHLAALGRQAEGAVGAWAAWSAGLLGDATITGTLEGLARSGGPVAGPAMEVMIRRNSPERAAAWIRALGADQANGRLMIQAMGALGDAAAVPWLLDRMADAPLARIAAESFCLITGADLALDDLEGAAPEGFAAGPAADPGEAGVAPGVDEELPWPNRAKIAAWWATRARARGRQLLGAPSDLAAFERAWCHGYQRQRRAAAYGLAVAQPGTGLRDWRRRITAR